MKRARKFMMCYCHRIDRTAMPFPIAARYGVLRPLCSLPAELKVRDCLRLRSLLILLLSFLYRCPGRPVTHVAPRYFTEDLPTDAGLVALIRKAKGNMEAESAQRWFEIWREQGDFSAIEGARESYFSQMWDVSQFMKVLKQRFTQWFNGSRPVRRKGTLWEDRFRSVLVESGEALRAMAAYIDLNPIRANLVSDPKDYRWSGYGEACAGRRLARKGLQRVLTGLGQEDAKDAATVSGMLS